MKWNSLQSWLKQRKESLDIFTGKTVPTLQKMKQTNAVIEKFLPEWWVPMK